MKSFSSFIKEYSKPLYATVVEGVATIDHLELFNELKAMAEKNQYKIYVKENNYIDSAANIKYFRKMFPTHARNIVPCGDAVLESIVDEALGHRFTSLNVMQSPHAKIVESTRITHKTIFRKSIPNTVSMVDFAKDNDFISFSQHVTEHLSSADTRKMFNDIRIGLGLQEKKEFKQELKFKPVSEEREAFVEGKLFNLYETVIVKETGETGKIVNLGSNYVAVESRGKTSKHWIHAVVPVDQNNNVKEAAKAIVKWGSKKYRLPDEGTDAAAKHAMKKVPHSGRNLKSFETYTKKDNK